MVDRPRRWRPLLNLLALGAGLAALPAMAATPTPAPLPLIPMPVQVQRDAGHVRVDDHTVIVAPRDDQQAAFAAHYLARMAGHLRGLHLHVRTHGKAGAHDIALVLDPGAPVTQQGGYTLDVSTSGIRIRARDEAGLFHGAVTLGQLLSPDAHRGAVEVPDLAIRDWPRFRWRGLMLDSARHMQSVAEIRRILDQMAQHKLDVFHWHLSDDQGWRLQIKGYPQFTRIGAWRTPPAAGTHGEPQRYGGFYTQAQVRAIVAYAARRHITVVPELDMPGHAQAAVASYPRIGVTGKRPPVSVDWGVNPYLYGVDDHAFSVIEHVLDQVMALFPSHYIHIGGDEAIKDQWNASPAVRAKMRALHIDSANALQGWFTDRIGQYLAAHGRRLVGWDEILQGGKLPPSAVVMSWRGTKGAVEAAAKGHDVILSPAPDLYFDNLQGARTDVRSGRLAIRTLAQVYAFEAVPSSMDPAQAGHVLGAQANVWTEYLTAPWEIEHAVFPRLDAFAEAVWSPDAVREWHGFLARLPAQLARYRAQHIDFADSAFQPRIEVDRNRALASGKAEVTLTNQTGDGVIHYTADGSAPDPQSPVYRAPFDVRLPTTLRAATFTAGGARLSGDHGRVLDRTHLLTRTSQQLQACPKGSMGLRVPLVPDATTKGPVYDVDLFHSCWVYPKARLDNVDAITVDAARLARNYGLAHDASKVVAYPAHTKYGELEVHMDSCDGPLLADMPLPAGHAIGQRLHLHAALPRRSGVHDLCLRFTAPIHGPLYAIGKVHLHPSAKH